MEGKGGQGGLEDERGSGVNARQAPQRITGDSKVRRVMSDEWRLAGVFKVGGMEYSSTSHVRIGTSEGCRGGKEVAGEEWRGGGLRLKVDEMNCHMRIMIAGRATYSCPCCLVPWKRTQGLEWRPVSAFDVNVP